MLLKPNKPNKCSHAFFLDIHTGRWKSKYSNIPHFWNHLKPFLRLLGRYIGIFFTKFPAQSDIYCTWRGFSGENVASGFFPLFFFSYLCIARSTCWWKARNTFGIYLYIYTYIYTLKLFLPSEKCPRFYVASVSKIKLRLETTFTVSGL